MYCPGSPGGSERSTRLRSVAVVGLVGDPPAAADLHGKVALVATGHAIALVPGVLAATLRADVTTLALVDPPTRGIYAVLPHRDPHPAAPLLVQRIMASFR